MADTYTTYLNLAKPGDGDTSWGDNIRNFMDTMDELALVQNLWRVSPLYTVPNLYPYGAPGTRRHFDTIQGAIDAAGGNDTRDTILIYPGTYTENLSISGRMILVGAAPCGGYSYGVRIDGNQADPCVTWSPTAGNIDQLGLHNLSFVQTGSDPGTAVNKSLAIEVVDQGSGNYGGSRNTIDIKGCAFNFGSTVGSRAWDHLYSANGYNRSLFHNCVFRMSSTIVDPFEVYGNNTTSRAAEFYMRGCTLHWNGTPTNTYFDFNEGVDGLYCYNVSEHARSTLVTFGGTGTNNVTGLNTDSEFIDHHNISGVVPMI